ncbi:unnamed protein product [Allacma fusca]|uniref:Uncharacterized protein n=1 Tax=Allacma fusca TaxID=39272 RepID=A0A8J2PGJ0_9HEXA|nr:unnamed protein product [Allacma fusca]
MPFKSKCEAQEKESRLAVLHFDQGDNVETDKISQLTEMRGKSVVNGWELLSFASICKSSPAEHKEANSSVCYQRRPTSFTKAATIIMVRRMPRICF